MSLTHGDEHDSPGVAVAAVLDGRASMAVRRRVALAMHAVREDGTPMIDDDTIRATLLDRSLYGPLWYDELNAKCREVVDKLISDGILTRDGAAVQLSEGGRERVTRERI